MFCSLFPSFGTGWLCLQSHFYQEHNGNLLILTAYVKIFKSAAVVSINDPLDRDVYVVFLFLVFLCISAASESPLKRSPFRGVSSEN